MKSHYNDKIESYTINDSLFEMILACPIPHNESINIIMKPVSS